MKSTAIGVMLVGLGVIVAGVAIGGTAEHPSTLFLPYLFATGVVELGRRRQHAWLRLAIIPAVLGLSAGGVAWTIGVDHMRSNTSMLVWVGMALLVAGSLEAAGGKGQSSTDIS